MIRELIEYCLTPASSQAKKNGYLYEAMAFESRAKRNQKSWQPHWTFCQEMVKEFVCSHPHAQSIAIFGSGCLFEIPKEFLVQRKMNLVLIDQVFPRSVRSWIEKQKVSIELCEMDLAEGEFSNFDCDLALSANLLSQLALPKRHHQNQSQIQKRHLDHLQKLGIPCLGWTDVERLYRQRNTNQVIESDATVLCELPTIQNEWTWNLAPAPEWHREVDLVLKMQSFVY